MDQSVCDNNWCPDLRFGDPDHRLGDICLAFRCRNTLTLALVASTISTHEYEVRPRKDHRGVDLISDALPFGRLWYGEPNAISNAIDYAKFYSRSHDAVIRVYNDAGNVIETHEHTGDFKEW
jgi:hypothetical protein